MVELVIRKITATHPSHHVAVGGVQRQKTGLQACFVIPKFLHKCDIKHKRLQSLLRCLTCSYGSSVFLGIAHKRQDQVFARPTAFGPHDPAGGPFSIRYFLQPIGLQGHGRVGHCLQP